MGLEFLSCQTHREGKPQYKLHTLRVFLLIVAVTVYLMVGAAIFLAIESAKERMDQRNLDSAITAFIKSHDSCVSKTDVEELVKIVSDASERGIKWHGNRTVVSNWNYGQSFFFCGTLISTVGYGQISPNTSAGKAFTIFYCLFGIPMFLVFLSILVERIRAPALNLRDAMMERYRNVMPESRIRFMHLGLLSAVMLVFLFLLPAAIFQSIEGSWTYLDAFYYCFVSLTTIGLGDYVPGSGSDRSYSDIYNILTTAYLIVGLVGMMLFLSVIYDTPELNLKHFLIDHSYDQQEKASLRDQIAKPSYTKSMDEDEHRRTGLDTPDITRQSDYAY